MFEYVQESYDKILHERKERYLFDSIMVFLKDPIIGNVDLNQVLKIIEDRIPQRFFFGIDVIYVGEFDIFHERNINALYKDGAIYVSNVQDDEADMVDDIVHELAHSVLEKNNQKVLYDDFLEREFFAKKKILLKILNEYDFNPDKESFLKAEFDPDLDEFLYIDVGYPFLRSVSSGIFNSPYAITSLDEYFANGFEEYFLRNMKTLEKISPILFKKIENLVYEEENI